MIKERRRRARRATTIRARKSVPRNVEVLSWNRFFGRAGKNNCKSNRRSFDFAQDDRFVVAQDDGDLGGFSV